MPIAYRIDHERRIIVARGYGMFSEKDVFDYQHEAWASRDVIGYDELVDMSHVSDVTLPPGGRVKELASFAALMDLAPSRLAIVAPGDLAYGLGRVFQAYRHGETQSAKQVGVFRSLEEAVTFLGLKELPPLPPLPPDAVGERLDGT
jgi:hypothetical protein